MNREQFPKIRAVIVWRRIFNGKKTPKYGVAMWGGSKEYVAMLHSNLTGRDGISCYYKKSRSTKPDAPEMNIEVKGSQNLTGLYQWFEFGKLSGYAYGFPEDKPTTGGQKPRPNCFYPYKEDAFLFRSTPNIGDPKDTLPMEIEWIILEGKGANTQAPRYLTMLKQGGFDDALAQISLREYNADEFPPLYVGKRNKK